MKLRPALFLLLMWSGPALAASRLVVTMQDPGMIYVDDQLIQTGPGVQKAVVNYIDPGVHRILIRQTDGILLYQGTVSIPVDSEVSALFAGERFTVTSPVGTTDSSEAEVAGTQSVAADAKAEAGEVESTFDMNEGSAPTSISSSDSTPRAGGNYSNWSGTARTAGQVGGVVAPTVTGAVTLGSVAVSSAASAVRNACAGGVDSLRRSSGSSGWRQGRPIPPAAVTGYAALSYEGEKPVTIYVAGFVVAELSGSGSGKVKLEVGRHEVEIWDTAARLVLWKGVLQIEKDYTVPLAFSETRAPVATERPWLWSAR